MTNNKGSRRRFGAIRQLPSGQWQARYPGPDGVMRPADKTFRTKTGAAEWLVDKEAEMRSGDWIDPEAGKITLSKYAETWVAEAENAAHDARALGDARTAAHCSVPR